MLGIILKRVVGALLTLLGVSAFIFLFAEVLPGDIAERVLGQGSTEEQRALFRSDAGLDRPVWERYLDWLGGVVQVDFGQSLVSGRPVTSVVGPALSNTLQLSLFAFLLYLPITVIVATIGALYRDRLPDALSSLATLLVLSLPEFVLATFLMVLFAVALPVFPALSFVDATTTVGERLRMLTLPAVTLALVMAAYAIRMLRDSLLEVLDSEYIRTATLKGVPRWRVAMRHALPNALGPALNVTALNLTYLIGGVVVVEQVFSFPGLGRLLVDVISNRDIPTIECIVLIASGLYIAANLVADLLARALNPRLRAG